MKRLSKIIITQMEIYGHLCTVCAVWEDQKIMELHLSSEEEKSVLNNIYVGQVESISQNIGAAFIRIGKEGNGYFPLKEQEYALFTSGRKGNRPLSAGDELLVQVNRAAMKGKLPALTANLNFPGKYLALTTGKKKLGFSSKLSNEEKARLGKWLREELDVEKEAYGIVVRTNAGEASKEEIFREYAYLRRIYEKTVQNGRSRVCFSLLYEGEPFYLSVVRDSYLEELEEIVTDIPEIFQKTREYLEDFCPKEKEKLRLYEDKLLPLFKLYALEGAIEEIQKEKVWLKSGGFLVIQQTEAFVSIDVNSGKFTGKKKAEETYRKINREAALEIARQLRLRNLSGIILIDFINMENPDHQEELFHVLQKHLRRDRVKSRVVDITPLHILEMTRKKVAPPVIEELKALQKERT